MCLKIILNWIRFLWTRFDGVFVYHLLSTPPKLLRNTLIRQLFGGWDKLYPNEWTMSYNHFAAESLYLAKASRKMCDVWYIKKTFSGLCILCSTVVYTYIFLTTFILLLRDTAQQCLFNIKNIHLYCFVFIQIVLY